MRKFITYFGLFNIAVLFVMPAFAITLTNQDGQTRQIRITENGARSARDISAGETVQLCEKGCFVTFPDGTLTAYKGNEKIVIRDGGPALAK